MDIYQLEKKIFQPIFLKILFITIPLSFIIGNALLNICFVSLILYFLYKIIINKDYGYLNNIYFKLLIIFWIYLLLNSIIINYSQTTFFKSFSYIRFILLPFAIIYFFKKKFLSKKIIFYFYSILSSLISIDIIIQYFKGINILGYPPKLCVAIAKERLINIPGNKIMVYDMPNYPILSVIDNPDNSNQFLVNCERFSGIFNNELIAGSFLLLIMLPFLIFLMNFRNEIKYSNVIFIPTFFLIIFASIISGDRTPILIFIISIFVLFLLSNISFLKKIAYVFVLFFICSYIIISTPHLKHRFIDWPLQTLSKTKISEQIKFKQEQNLLKIFLFKTQWGLHYLTAYDLAKENLFFGKGVKSFREICKNHNIHYLKGKYLKEYEYKLYQGSSDTGCSSHPHNFYFELLTDTGLIGLLIFIAFLSVFIIRIYFGTKNKSLVFLFILSILVSFMFPLKPTGSMFSTWHGYLMWIIISFYLYWDETISKKIK
jgi:O-antigen ligase